MLPFQLFKQLQHLSVHDSLCHWILDFLLHRKQVVRVNSKTSRVKYISTGPRRSVSYPPRVEVERVGSFRFLGTIISSSLKWGDNLSCIIKKAHQRLFFLRQLRKFGVVCKGIGCYSIVPLSSVFSPTLLLPGMETPSSRTGYS